jgi:hypothetical protein
MEGKDDAPKNNTEMNHVDNADREHDEVLLHLPKSFRVFSTILRKARRLELSNDEK